MEQPNDHPFPQNLYERKEKVLDETSDSDALRLRIMQWNVLADCLCYNFPKVPSEYQQKEYRLPLILEEIQQAGYTLDSSAGTGSCKLAYVGIGRKDIGLVGREWWKYARVLELVKGVLGFGGI